MSSLLFSLPRDVLISNIIMPYLHAVDVKRLVMCSKNCHRLCDTSKEFRDQHVWITKLRRELTRYAQTMWLMMTDPMQYFYVNTTIERESNGKILMRYVSPDDDDDDDNNDDPYYAFDRKEFDEAIKKLDDGCSKIIRAWPNNCPDGYGDTRPVLADWMCQFFQSPTGSVLASIINFNESNRSCAGLLSRHIITSLGVNAGQQLRLAFIGAIMENSYCSGSSLYSELNDVWEQHIHDPDVLVTLFCEKVSFLPLTWVDEMVRRTLLLGEHCVDGITPLTLDQWHAIVAADGVIL